MGRDLPSSWARNFKIEEKKDNKGPTFSQERQDFEPTGGGFC